MELVQLVYASSYAKDLALEDMREIARTSQRNNSKVGITGMLLFGDRQFLQCLEGGRSVVTKTFVRIAADERHTQVVLIEIVPIVERQFGAWSMAHQQVAKLDPEMIARYTPNGCFDPLKMMAAQATGLLREAAAMQKKVREDAA